MATMLPVTALTDFHPETFGRELTRLRTDSHLSQRQLGMLSDVSHTAISELEKGGAPPPHPSMLMKLAQGLVKTGSGDVDERRADEMYFTLMRAAGYVPEVRELSAEAKFREQLILRLGPDNAPLMELLIIKMRGRGSAEQRTAITVADILLNTLPSFR